jgi:hypothetical protein
MADPFAMNTLGQHYDMALKGIKGWQVATPGFHFRNLFGGVFNNWLAQVTPTSYNEFGKVHRAYNRKINGNPESWDALDEVFKRRYEDNIYPTLGHGQYGAGELSDLKNYKGAGKVLNYALGAKNPVVRFSRNTGGRVESNLRGTLMWDVLKKGGTKDDAFDAVAKYHFNYDDLSDFERKTVRRVIPFYTWTRRNMPLQFENMVTQPGKYAAFTKAQKEFTQNSPQGPEAPDRFSLFGFPTPLNIGGNQAFAKLDLPFTETLQAPFNIEQGGPISMVTPLIKNPVEEIRGKSFFYNQDLNKEVEVPGMYSSIPGLMPALDAAGIVEKGPDGWVTKAKWLHHVESGLPVLARGRRLAPSDKKYQERTLQSWLNFFGLPMNVNTPSQQELAKRYNK